MNVRAILLGLFLLAGCLRSFAQRTEGFVMKNSGCPITFSASRDGTLVYRAGRDLASARGASPVRVNVRLGGASLARVVEVTGRIYGTTAAPHLQGVASNGVDTLETDGPNTRIQTFSLSGFRPDEPTSDWKLDVLCVPLIQGISLSEIRMSDGSVWRESVNSHCQASVNGLLRVAG